MSRRWIKWGDIEKQWLLKNYEKYKYDHKLLCRMFNKHDIHQIQRMGSILSNTKRKRYTHNENYFENVNNLSCYIAGFIAGDGCVNKTKNGTVPNRMRISLHAGYSEYKLLKAIKNQLEFNGPINQTKGLTVVNKKMKRTEYSVRDRATKKLHLSRKPKNPNKIQN